MLALALQSRVSEVTYGFVVYFIYGIFFYMYTYSSCLFLFTNLYMCLGVWSRYTSRYCFKSDFLNINSRFLLEFTNNCFSCGYTAAKIGEGILLDHGTGLVIGETAVIGDRVSLMQVSFIIANFIN